MTDNICSNAKVCSILIFKFFFHTTAVKYNRTLMARLLDYEILFETGVARVNKG